MVRLSLFIALSCVAVALGAQYPLDGRIVGGANANEGQFPYQVSLRSTSNSHFCGGSVLNSRWIVTAAHCISGRAPSSTLVVVGTINRVTGGTTYKVSRIVAHEKYNPNQNMNDIGVVQTSESIEFTVNVAPIEMSDAVGGDVTVTASGWGQTSNPGSAPTILQWLDVKTLDNEDCKARLQSVGAHYYIYDNTICTTSPTGQGMCFGDSGGPIVSKDDGKLVGAVSWGIPCAKVQPDVFARISTHKDWINSHIN